MLSYAYQWRRCDASGESCAAITGATGQDYTTSSADVGHTVRVAVTASDQGASGTASSEPTGTIVAADPLSNITPPSISGSAEELQTLTATAGEWAGSAPISYAYQWENCSAEGDECYEIPGATSSTYKVDQGDAGSKLKTRVTASNAAGSSVADSSTTAVIAGAPAPVSTVQPSVTLLGPPEPGATAVTDGGTWENIEPAPAPMALSYQWQRCNAEGGECEEIVDGTQPTYEIGAEDGGSRLRVVVSAQNDTGRTSSGSQLTTMIDSTIAASSEKIIYTNESGLYSANIDGSESQQLTTCAAIDPEVGSEGCALHHPSISPTGEMLAVEARLPNATDTCGESQLCPNEDSTPDGRIILINYDGSDPRTLLVGASQPTWSPDGTVLAFTRTTGYGESATKQLYTVQADGSNAEAPARIETDTAESESPGYSPTAADSLRRPRI